MAQKRHATAPLPIFNKAKRPRLPLVAHPSNGRQELQTSAEANTTSHTRACRPQYAYHPQPSTFSRQLQQENHPQANPFQQSASQSTPLGPYKATYSKQRAANQYSNYNCQNESYIRYDDPRPSESAHPSLSLNSVHPSLSSASSSFHTPNKLPSAPMSRGMASSMASTAVGFANEPTTSQRAQAHHSHAVKEMKAMCKPTLRFLTATAQGMNHWAKYKTHSPFLFEIFGTLCLPGVKSLGTNCREFCVDTQDGTVRCQFWEIDRALPPLTVRNVYRVVGQWDDKVGVFKCYSVRNVRVGEVEAGKEAVEVSDRAMRRSVSSVNES